MKENLFGAGCWKLECQPCFLCSLIMILISCLLTADFLGSLLEVCFQMVSF